MSSLYEPASLIQGAPKGADVRLSKLICCCSKKVHGPQQTARTDLSTRQWMPDHQLPLLHRNSCCVPSALLAARTEFRFPSLPYQQPQSIPRAGYWTPGQPRQGACSCRTMALILFRHGSGRHSAVAGSIASLPKGSAHVIMGSTWHSALQARPQEVIMMDAWG